MGRPRKYPIQETNQPDVNNIEPKKEDTKNLKTYPDDDMGTAAEPEPLPYVPHAALRAQQEIQQQKAGIRTKEASGCDYEPSGGLECPSCRSLFILVSKSERKLGTIRRRRVCQKCNRAWYTVERAETDEQNRSEP